MSETQRPTLSQRVMRGAAWSTAVTVFSLPLAVATTLVLARALGIKGFGAFSFYTFTTGLVMGLSEVGLGSSMIQRAAHAVGREDGPGLMQAVRAAVTLSIVRIPIVVTAGYLLLPGRLAPALFAGAVVSQLMFIGPSYYLVSSSNLELPSKVRLVSVVLTAGASIWVAVETHDPSLTFAATALCTNAPTGLQVIGVPRGHRLASLLPGRPRLQRSDLTFGLGSFLNGQVTGFVFSRSELLFFGPGAAAARGRFAAAETIAARSTLVLDSLFGALPTALATAAGRGPEALKRAFGRVSRTTLALLGLSAPTLAVLVVTVAPPALGHGYSSVAPLALALTAASLLQTGSLPLGLLRYAERKIRPLLVAGVGAAGLDAVLAWWLVPSYAATGATIANSASGLAYVLISTGLLMRSTEWRSPAYHHTRATAQIVGMSAACGAIALFVPGAFEALAAGLVTALGVTYLLMHTVVPADERDFPPRVRAAALRLRLVRRFASEAERA